MTFYILHYINNSFRVEGVFTNFLQAQEIFLDQSVAITSLLVESDRKLPAVWGVHYQDFKVIQSQLHGEKFDFDNIEKSDLSNLNPKTHEFKDSNRVWWTVTILPTGVNTKDSPWLLEDEPIDYEWFWKIDREHLQGCQPSCTWQGKIWGQYEETPSLKDVLRDFQAQVMSICFDGYK